MRLVGSAAEADKRKTFLGPDARTLLMFATIRKQFKTVQLPRFDRDHRRPVRRPLDHGGSATRRKPMSKRDQPVVWVLVADGARARVVVPAAREGQFATRIAFDHASARLHADAGAGAADRRYEAAESAHHTEEGFAAAVAAHINAHALQHDFDQLVLVAPGRTLHRLRDAIGPQATAMVVGSVAHDYAGLADHELSPHLAQWWLAPAA
jgi:protein required for attachment to host cells